MASARTHCPKCQTPSAKSLEGLIGSGVYDYFTCLDCCRVWLIPKHTNQPVFGLDVVRVSPQLVPVD